MNKVFVKPLSINKCFQGRRYKTKDYKAYENDLMLKLQPIELPSKPYELIINFGFKNKLSDIDNALKPTLDILQKKYGFNDRDIYKLIVEKVITKQPFIEFHLKSYK